MSLELSKPFELCPIFRERVWGRESLLPFFPTASGQERIGEVWYTFEENFTSLGKFLREIIRENPAVLGTAADQQHPGICPLLVKLIFTTERLSVQVHPDDEYAERHHGSLGKTEAWYVIDSTPPGEVAIGFKESLTPERFRESISTGEIEQLLDWRKVEAGNVIFTPAGTVHAIGAGLTVCEVQENSDITYRLYDYGRPRELHLDHGIAVSKLSRHETECEPKRLDDWRQDLMNCEYFRMERLQPRKSIRLRQGLECFLLLICVDGFGTIADQPFKTGSGWMVPAGNAEFVLNGPGSEWILTYKAQSPLKLEA